MSVMTARRADALMTELEVVFSAKTLQTKLQNAFDEAAGDGLPFSSNPPGKCKLIRRVTQDIFARYGLEHTDQPGLDQFLLVLYKITTTFSDLATRVEHILKVLRFDTTTCHAFFREHCLRNADAKERLDDTRKDSQQQRCQKAETWSVAASTRQASLSPSANRSPRPVLPEPVRLSLDEALALQAELLRDFSSPAFQKKLHELARAQGVKEGQQNNGYSAAFRQLVREVQFNILPRHGFEASEKGVQEMIAAFKLLESSQDIFVQSVAIKDALFPGSSDVKSVPALLKADRGSRPETASGIARLLRFQLIKFSQPRFQRTISCLKRVAADQNAHGYYHLPGRAEAALRQQREILVAFGFEATRAGVQDMVTHCAKFLQDPQIASLLDGVNEKLGMSPAARLRFRRLAESLAPPPLDR